MKKQQHNFNYQFVLIIALFFTLTKELFAQIETSLHWTNQIVVTDNGRELSHAWLGGFNNPQFSEIDVNQDGFKDLFVFDRGNNGVYIFKNKGITNKIAYVYAPNWVKFFPSELRSWVRLLDYNCDDIEDIFTSYNEDYMRVFTGKRNADNELIYELHTDVLTHNGDSTILVNQRDIPGLADVDGDGDIDVVTFQFSGGFVDYFENVGANCGDLLFVKNTDCWGEFFENGINPDLVLNNCMGKKNRIDPAHAGSTLLLLDLDFDGDQDLLLGDLNFDNLILARNGGNKQQAKIKSQDIFFPSYDIPALVRLFPAAFLADVNNDDYQDLLVAPNQPLGSNNYTCSWLYLHTPNPDSMAFIYESNQFLVSDMLDFNRQAHPVFFDHNTDGLLDLVVGHFAYISEDEEVGFEAALALLENTGTPNAPAFELVDRDWMKLGQQFSNRTLGLHPTFGDIDADGDADMLVGAANGSIHLFVNEPKNGVAQFNLIEENYQNIRVNQQCSPQLIDLNRDGLLDLAIGYLNGPIEYWENTGTASEAIFTRQNPFLGLVDVKEQNEFEGRSKPYFIDWQDQFWLVVGSQSGKVALYDAIDGQLGANKSFRLLDNNILNTNNLVQTSPAIADADADGRLEMVVGTFRGGLMWYEEGEVTLVGLSDSDFADKNADVHIYPNPNSGELTIIFPNINQELVKYNLFNSLGQKVQEIVWQSSATQRLKLPNLTAGIYFLQIVLDKKSYVEKIVVK